MSSNQLTERPALAVRPPTGRPRPPTGRPRLPDWRPVGTWSLRARLTAMLLVVLAALSLAIGVVTILAMRDFLLHQLDSRLIAAGDRSRVGYSAPGDSAGAGQPVPGNRPDPNRRGRAPGLPPSGQGPGTLSVRMLAGQVVEASFLDAGGELRPVPEIYWADLVDWPRIGLPYSRDLGELGRYRLLVWQSPNPQEALITGLPLEDAYATLYRLAAVEAAVTVLALVAAGWGGVALIRVNLRPLRRIAATAGQVADLPLHTGDAPLSVRVQAADTDPRTEVGQVGAALNRMLGYVDAAFAERQASEDRLRQFVADASHELRTPLAAIRGYAELGARSRDQVPPEVAQVLDRVGCSAVRMTTLVEDLLLLARLDAGRPLEREPVDLTALVIEAVGDAHVAGPAQHWRLDLPDEPVVVVGDAARLHQVLANLLANARTHTPPDTVVTTVLETAGERVRVRVADDGPGIPDQVQPTIFERFARGDSSRSRAAGSTGLGLAIVAAVVTAHQGEVTVTSRPGETVFTVSLPLVAD